MKTWKKGVLSSRCWGLTSFSSLGIHMDRMVHQQAPGILGQEEVILHEVTVWEEWWSGGMKTNSVGCM